MTPAIRIGDPVQVKDETEHLTLVCLDCGRAWVRDGAGNHLDYPEEDLVRFEPIKMRMPTDPLKRFRVSGIGWTS